MHVLFKVSQGLELSIQKAKIMASGSNHFMENRQGNNENNNTFIFLGSKITADSDCSHEIKTLAPWKKSYDNQVC